MSYSTGQSPNGNYDVYQVHPGSDGVVMDYGFGKNNNGRTVADGPRYGN